MTRAGMRRRAAAGLLVLGVVAGAVALAPRLLSPRLSSWAERDFERRHAGRLEVGALRLGWTGEQRAETVALYDPEGALVARGRAVLPALGAWLRRGLRRPGRVRVELEAEIVRGPDGRTNLERALAPRARRPAGTGSAPRREPEASQGSQSGLEELEELDLELRAPRIVWRDELRATEVFLSDVELDWTRGPDAPDALRLAAQVEGPSAVRGGPGRIELTAGASAHWAGHGWPGRLDLRARGERIPTRILSPELAQALGEAIDLDLSGSLEAGLGPLAADVRAGEAQGRLELDLRQPLGRGSALALEASARGVETAVLDALLDTPALLAGALGETLELELSGEVEGAGADRGGPFELKLDARGAALSARGLWRGRHLTSGPDGGLEAELHLAPALSQRVLEPLLPFVGLAAASSPTPVSLALRDVDLDLDHPSRLAAELEIALGPTRLALAPELEHALGQPLAVAFDGQPFEIELDAGQATYRGLTPSIGGHSVPIAGGVDLLTGALQLDLELPARLLAQRLARDLGPAAAALGETLSVGVEVRGTRTAPRVRLAPPDPERLREGAGRALEDALRGVLGDG